MKDIYNTLDHSDLSEETYFTLKEKILLRQLKPGSKISINEVASGLGVSRTPVVVALQRLAGEGLVVIHPRRGSFVKGITAEEVEDVFEVRRMFELYAAQFILENGLVRQFLEAVRTAESLMDQAVSGEEYLDYPSFMQGDRNFHTILVEQTGNGRIVDIYRDLNVHIHVARAHYVDDVENAYQIQREHKLFIDALQRGNLEETQAVLNAHINNVKSRIVRLIKDEGGLI